MTSPFRNTYPVTRSCLPNILCQDALVAETETFEDSNVDDFTHEQLAFAPRLAITESLQVSWASVICGQLLEQNVDAVTCQET